jgi:hypothetical protein
LSGGFVHTQVSRRILNRILLKITDLIKHPHPPKLSREEICQKKNDIAS